MYIYIYIEDIYIYIYICTCAHADARARKRPRTLRRKQRHPHTLEQARIHGTVTRTYTQAHMRMPGNMKIPHKIRKASSQAQFCPQNGYLGLVRALYGGKLKPQAQATRKFWAGTPMRNTLGSPKKIPKPSPKHQNDTAAGASWP